MNSLLYHVEKGIYVTVKATDFVNSKVLLQSIEDETVELVVGFEEFDTTLEKISPLGVKMDSFDDEDNAVIVGLLNHDLISREDDNELFELVHSHKEGVVDFVIHTLVDNELVSEGVIAESVAIEDLEDFIGEVLTDYIVEGNVYEIKKTLEEVKAIQETKEVEQTKEVSLDFDIKIVKVTQEGLLNEGSAYYVCNDKKRNTIDLIEVIFIGATLLNGEYNRLTINHGVYKNLVETGVVEEITPYQLMAFAMNKAQIDKGFVRNADADIDIDEDTTEDVKVEVEIDLDAQTDEDCAVLGGGCDCEYGTCRKLD